MSAALNRLLEGLPWGRGIRVLAEDASGMVALSKPAGVLSHPNTAAASDRAILTAEFDAKGDCYVVPELPEGRFWLLNRLDSATSGVILGAVREATAQSGWQAFRQRRVSKRYVAQVFGHPSPGEQTWRDRLGVEKRGGRIRTSSRGALPSECRMKPLDGGTVGDLEVSLIQLEPRTGRSHQLRVQCARRHLPIVGDQTYGDFARNRAWTRLTGSKRLYLHACAVSFSYEVDGRRHEFSASAPIPPEFQDWA